MSYAWIGLFFELCILALLQPIIDDFEITMICVIGINMIFVLVGIVKHKYDLRGVLLSAFLLRLILMFWDIYGRNIYILPHSNSDSEGFRNSAYLIAYNINLIYSDIYGGLYPKFLGLIYYFTSPQDLLGQYLNVLFGLTTIFIIIKIFDLLAIDKRVVRKLVILLAFFPFSIIFSAILLREAIITMLVTLSFYYFIKWYQVNSIRDMMQSILYLLVASLFHSGVIGIVAGYLLIYLFYNHKSDTLSFSKKSIVFLVLFTALGYFIIEDLSDLLLAKFQRMDEIEDMYDVANSRRGNAAYLTNIEISSFSDVLIYGPIKALYFLASPLPFDWRDTTDIIAFILDGIVYLGIILFTVFNLNIIKKRPLGVGILVMVIAVSLIFGIGVSNAGTALRHRSKILPILVVFGAVITDIKKRQVRESRETVGMI